MIRSRVKTIIIILLIIIDLFIAALLLLNTANEASTRAKTVAELSELLSGMGIELKEGAVGGRVYGFYTAEAARKTENEKSAAEILIGNTAELSSSGGTNRFSAGDYEVSFGSDGAVSALVSAQDAGDMASLASRMLSVSVPGRGGWSDKEISKGTVWLFNQLYNGLPVYNCSLLFEKKGESLAVSGNWVFGAIVGEGRSQARDIPAVILDFALENENRGLGVTLISSASAGYRASVYAGGNLILTPVCKLETDKGIFYMNAQTGILLDIG